MRASLVRRWLADITLVVLLVVVGSGAVTAQGPDDVGALNAQVSELYGQGKYGEATELAKRALALTETASGPDHPDVGTLLNNLAYLYQSQSRAAEAERLYKRSLELRERVLGPYHPDVGRTLNNLAELYRERSRYREAETLYERSLALLEKALGPDHPEIGTTLNNLALLYRAQGRNAEAEPLYKRSLALAEKVLGPDHPEVGTSLNNLAELHAAQGRYAEAEPLYKRCLALREKALGPDHPDVGVTLNNLAQLYVAQGRYREAESHYKASLAVVEKGLGPDHPFVGALLTNVADLHRAQGRFAEAEALYKESLALRERVLGPDHGDVGATLNNLAQLYQAQGRYREAEPLYKRSLALRERTLGPDHPDVGATLNNLALLSRAQGRYAEAEPLYKRTLALVEKVLGPDHPSVGTALNNLAELHAAQGRYEEAEPLFKRSLALREKALGPDHPHVGVSLNNLAVLYQAQGRYREAEPLFKRSLALAEKALGSDHPDVGGALTNLAELYQSQGRYAEAEPLYKRSLALRERTLGSDHPDVGRTLNSLAGLFQAQGHTVEAEPLYKRGLALVEKALGPDHPSVGTALNNLARLYQGQGRYAEAEPLYKRSLALREKALGPDHPEVGTSLNDIAGLYQSQGRFAEAEPLYKRSLALLEKGMGPDHPAVGAALNNLAVLYRAQGRYREAEALNKRSLALLEQALGPDHPDVGTSLISLAELHLVQRDWARAVDLWRRSTALTVRRAQRGTLAEPQTSIRAKSEANQLGYRFSALVKVMNHLSSEQNSAAALAAEAFDAAQWALGSDAAASLAQMAARGAAGNPELAAIVRERQDLVAEWQRRDGAHTAAVSQPPAKRDTKAEAVNIARLTEIEARISGIDKRLSAEFPDYAALASSGPLSIEQVQAELRVDEALVLFLDTPKLDPMPEETFVWVVTKTNVRWVRSDLGTPTLRREVAALRCGLDATAWDGDGFKRCGEVLRVAPGEFRPASSPLPFDHARARKLYVALFGEVGDMIRGKHLLLVPSGPLTQLPFQVLVTEPPKATDHKAIRWLARDNALTVLPAVSSLKALRRVAKPSAAEHPMIGFGNPLLDGNQSHPNPEYAAHYKTQAALARASQSCPETPWQRVAALLGARRSVDPIATRGGLADLAHLKVQSPLPETAQELCDVAASLRVDRRNIWLGARASEREIKRLSTATDAKRLANYRIVHFATHGTLAGQLNGTTEPGLILTPPATATDEDDGYLSAGEIASLKLDADWVILSACNTAGGADGPGGAEALGGLARAFFYAQARALLVSHWEVNSEATVKLITSTAGAMARDPSLGRAEALRRAMLAMIDSGKPNQAHPAYWAPFIVVGEGAVVW